MNTSQTFLAHGLQKSFAGETEFTSGRRAGFDLHISHLEEGGNVYHDEWSGKRVTGGQELVKVDEKMYTRVYAGGTISVDALQKLGIAEKDVMGYLVKCLNEFGEQTRLHKNFGPKKSGDWSYHYTVIEKNDAIPMTTGKEEISYKEQVVFVHVFVMCPVE